MDGAAAGQLGCIANVIRICARYGNLDIIEDGYGINLLPLATFAMRMYKDDPCTCFKLKGTDRPESDEMQMNLRIHKAISIIQFKVEGQIIERQKDSIWRIVRYCIRLIIRKVRLIWKEKNISFWIQISQQ